MNASRQLGLWACVALVVGNIVGSGIFLLPASLAPFGMNAVWAWLLTCAGALVLAWVFAALARAFPEAGGPQEYTRMAFGDTTSFMLVWSYWIGNWVGNAALATSAVSYLSNVLPWIAASPGHATLATIALVWILTAVNLASLRAAQRTQAATTVLKLLPLVAVVGIGLWLFVAGDARLGNAHLTRTPFDIHAVTAAAALTLWAMLGLESAAVVAARVRDPQNTIARASLLGTGLAAGVFLVASTTVMALIPGDRLANSHAPFADAVALFWGSGAAHAVALFAAVSCLGALNGWTFVNAQLSSQMARSGQLPGWFGRESARGTPSTSLWVNSLLTTALLLTAYGKSLIAVFNFMILLSTVTSLVMYLLCSLALLRLLGNGMLPAAHRRGATLALIGLGGTLYALWTLYGAGEDAVFWGMVLLLAGLPLHAWLRSTRRTVVA